MREQYGKLTLAIRRQVAGELRRVRAGAYPKTAWDTCVVAAAGMSRYSIAYRTLREVAIRFRPSSDDNAAQVEALARWFDSQEISPADAVVTMGMLTAAILVKNAKGDKGRLLVRMKLFFESMSAEAAYEWAKGRAQ